MSASSQLPASPASFEVRWATTNDWYRLGELALGGLTAAPSSEVGLEDVYEDPQEFGEQLLHGSACVLLAVDPTRSVALGAVRIVPREFIRASHIVELAILVAPRARRQEVGSRLLDLAVQTLIEEGRRAKVVVRIASDDEALQATLKATGRPWRLERVEKGALWRDGALVDMHLHGLDLS